jgi:hypothetical protein
LGDVLSGSESRNDPALVDLVWDKMWPLLNSYNIDGPDGYTTWFLMDEVGSALSHSRVPKCKVHPVCVTLQDMNGPGSEADQIQFSLSLMWPVRHTEVGDVLTRDYLPIIYGDDQSSVDNHFAELPLQQRIGILGSDGDKFKTTITLELWRQLKEVGYLDVPVKRAGAGAVDTVELLTELRSLATEVTSFLPSAKRRGSDTHCGVLDSAPVEWNPIQNKLAMAATTPNFKLKIYCDRDDYLSSEVLRDRGDRFEFVSNSLEADILYLIDHVIDEETDTEHSKREKVLTQFWWEGMIVTKNHFVRTMTAACCKAHRRKQRFFPATSSGRG